MARSGGVCLNSSARCALRAARRPMSEFMDLLGWLERWYREQCDGQWEQDHGVTIQTLDNSGWLVKVDLRGLKSGAMKDGVLVVLGEPPSAENGNVGGDIWLTCEVTSGHFVGAGDPTQLRAILAQFRKLAEEGGTPKQDVGEARA